MDAKEIVEYARSFKRFWNTNDPYKIAKRMGIVVLHRESAVKDFTAQTLKMEGYPTIISINDIYDDKAKRMLCAHELGHALLHGEGVNHFATTNENVHTDVELEANLFAVALLTDEEFDRQLTVPLHRLSNYMLKSIIECNI